MGELVSFVSIPEAKALADRLSDGHGIDVTLRQIDDVLKEQRAVGKDLRKLHAAAQKQLAGDLAEAQDDNGTIKLAWDSPFASLYAMAIKAKQLHQVLSRPLVAMLEQIDNSKCTLNKALMLGALS